MLISRKKYNDLLAALDKAIENNHELRKVCQCRECRYGLITIEGWGDKIMHCYNETSDNFYERMNPYGSCEKCERR